MKKHKVLIFSTAYFPLVGGAEVAIKEVTDRLEDFEFDLITARTTLSFQKNERLGNINIYRVGLGLGSLDKFLLPFLGLFLAFKLHNKNNYEIAWSIMASYAGVAASLFKRFRPEAKLVLTLQEGDEEDHLKRYVFGVNFLYKIFIRPWHMMPFKKANEITAISKYLEKRARKNDIKTAISLIPNGVDIELFQKPVGVFDLSNLYNFLKIDVSEKIIITTSRLVKKNAIADIINSLQFLPHDVRLLILGSGSLENELKEYAKNLKFWQRVRFLNFVEHDEIYKYLKIAHVFVRPSLSEGLGNSFLEAMAAGVPVVGTNVGGIPDFLKDGETGLFCEVNNPKSIAEKVNQIIENRELREKLIENGKKLVEDKYNWTIISAKMKDVFEKLL